MGNGLESGNFRKAHLAVVHVHSAELCAAAGGGEHFAWVEEFLGVECTFEPLLLSQVGLGELVPHQIALLDANPVLPSQPAAKIYTGLKNVRSKGFSLLKIARPGRIEQNH